MYTVHWICRNSGLNTLRKDVKDPNAILACRYFQAVGHNFNKNAKFVIIGKLLNANKAEDILREHLI